MFVIYDPSVKMHLCIDKYYQLYFDDANKYIKYDRPDPIYYFKTREEAIIVFNKLQNFWKNSCKIFSKKELESFLLLK